MMEPSLDLLMRKVGSKYALVVTTAKRARQLMAGEGSLVPSASEKAVTVALEEIAEDRVHCEQPNSAIK